MAEIEQIIGSLALSERVKQDALEVYRLIAEAESAAHGKVIGCSAVVYSERNAYLWYAAYLRKSYLHLHPDIITIWDTIKDAHRRGCEHICFMDVGLPYKKNPFREFILSFGGKEQSTYRWFRFSIRWVNALLAWIYRE